MFLHIGGDYTIHTKNIIAIMDLDTSTVSKISREFLDRVQRENEVINVSDEDLPKSYIVCEEKGKTTVYISPISSSTLLKRKNSDFNKSI